jgi:hypothetical protein
MKGSLIKIPDVDTFGSTSSRKIKVWSTPEFLACVDLISKVDIPKEAVWRVLTHRENFKVFRDIKVLNRAASTRGHDVHKRGAATPLPVTRHAPLRRK